MFKHWLAGAFMMCAGSVSATPMYYTFTGNVTEIDDYAGIIADAGVSIGAAVEYTYLADFDADGYVLHNDGSRYTFTDDITNYFYSDFISGGLIEEKDGGYNGRYDTKEFNYGSMHKYIDPYNADASKTVAHLHGGSSDERTDLRFLSSDLSLTLDDIFALGVAFEGFETAVDSSGNRSHLYSDLTLTNISAVADPDISAVPVPAAAWLFGSALLGFFGFSRRKTKA